MILKNKKIVITGGAGFIGSNIASELYMENEVTIVDNFFTGRKRNIEKLLRKKKITLIEGSVLHMSTLLRAFDGNDYVIHEAAIPSVPRSIKNPIKTNETNIRGTLNVLSAAKKRNIEKVVFAASSSAYGDTPTLPKVEEMPPNPASPYAVTKLTGEYYCKIFNDVYGLPTTALRYFNVYGPNQDPNSEYAAVIPRFITRILGNEPPIVYGDGTQSRDFTYVTDAVSATILACRSTKSNGEVINVATGKRVVLNDLIQKIAKHIGKKTTPKYVEPRTGDVKHSLADITKARELLGYSPRYTIDAGLPLTIEYFKNVEVV